MNMNATMNTVRLEQLKKLYNADPSDADISYMIAQEYGTADDHDQAIEWYDKCLAADPAYCYAYFFKAIALQALERKADSISTLNTGMVHATESKHAKTISEMTSLLEQFSA
jgi:tetratricopeptide (TPR) repeat protein